VRHVPQESIPWLYGCYDVHEKSRRKAFPQPNMRTARILGQPWFSAWNYRTLQALFKLIPHSLAKDNFAQFIVLNHLFSTWIFAGVFYLFWRIDDEQTVQRRWRLVQIIVAFIIAVVVTLLARAWAAWPAPSMNPPFQKLYPAYLWGSGVSNSFPSHATLTYFMVGVGLWPLNRPVSAVLTLFAVVAISLPRVYLGGHYPVDVIASLILVFATMGLIWLWRLPDSMRDWLGRRSRAGLREFLLFLWLFELGEEFGGFTRLLHACERLLIRT